jgi:hypothetical protein
MTARVSGEEDFELHQFRREPMRRESRVRSDEATQMQRIREQMVELVAEAEAEAEARWGSWAAGEGAMTLVECTLAALDEVRQVAAATR